MEPAITKRYIDIIAAIAASKEHTFRHRAKAMNAELLNKETDITERISWIDAGPADLFEAYLRLRVRGCPRQPK